MSQPSDYSNPHQCRWNWCRDTYPTVADLLAHVREHVRQTKSCRVSEIPELRRIEDGVGESLSGITMGFGSYQSVAQGSRCLHLLVCICLILDIGVDLAPNPPLSLPFPEVSSSSSSVPQALTTSFPSQDLSSPVLHAPLRAIDFSVLPDTPSRPLKRRKIMSPNNDLSPSRSRSNSVQTPPPRDLSRTPGFTSLAFPDSTQAVPNPEFPDFNTLISNTLAGVSAQNHFTTPNGKLLRGNANSQSFQASDAPLEGVLPNFVGLGDSQNLYAGELNWDDGSVPTLPRSRSRTPTPSSQSQSQQTRSSASSVDASLSLSQALPLQRRQSWYQSPRRVSNGKKTIIPGLAGQDVPSPATPQAKISTPVKTYLSGSFKISSPESHSQPYGEAINPRILHQPQYPEFSSQSQSPSSFVIQTQAPYRSQSTCTSQ
ncbi:hypothetical protein B0H12DRAFT_55598 [Mycena haematopus]|nr:hypothetical protein B0H12DRAFT_55598 [Mycena haematopus]